ncbi:hypothetical protein ACFU99_09185 [Streptomyces sp. NPDC057654]
MKPALFYAARRAAAPYKRAPDAVDIIPDDLAPDLDEQATCLLAK